METFTTAVGSWLAPVGAMLGPFAPRLLAALAILGAAWLAARLARLAVMRLAERSKLEDKLHSQGLAATLASVAAAGVWLLALPALLGTLELQGLLAPVNAMLSRLLGFVPNLFGSAVVLGVGLLMARIARQIVVGLLQAAGSEKAAQRIGMSGSLGPDGLAGIAGNALYVLILLPTLVAALQPLGLDALTQPLSRLLEAVTSTIPRLVSAVILVGVAVLIGRALATVVTALLAGVGLDTLPERLGAAPLRLAGRNLSELAGAGVMAVVVTVALAQASEILGLPVLTHIVSTVGAAAGQVAVALVLLGAGVFLASAAARAIQASSLRNATLLAWLARGGIVFFAAALAMRQAGLPPEIVTLAFGAVVGALALGLGVAIGVGGRHAAGRVMDRFVASFDAPQPASSMPLPAQAAPTAVPPAPPSGQPT